MVLLGVERFGPSRARPFFPYSWTKGGGACSGEQALQFLLTFLFINYYAGDLCHSGKLTSPSPPPAHTQRRLVSSCVRVSG